MFASLKFAARWFANTTDALLPSSIPWRLRWRLLMMQPITLLTYVLKYTPHLLSRRYNVIQISTRGKHTLRAIVFKPPCSQNAIADNSLLPLHIDFHGGGFLGGIAEYDSEFSEAVSDRTGAVVVSAQYRYAPANIYPAAHEDAEDVVDWVLANAKKLWRADPENLTVSGSSVGANLMFAAGRRAKAPVGICALTELRLAPWQKPIPATFPAKDPLWFALPLFDAYAGPVREQTKEDSRLNPILKDIADLPEHVLLLCAGIDILLHEELTFIERIRKDRDTNANESHRRFDAIVFKKGFHGWLELPSYLIPNAEDKKKVFDAATELIFHARTTR